MKKIRKYIGIFCIAFLLSIHSLNYFFYSESPSNYSLMLFLFILFIELRQTPINTTLNIENLYVNADEDKIITNHKP